MSAIKVADVRAIAHITGGGLVENLPRVLPEGLSARLATKCWPTLPVFDWIAEAGNVPQDEMRRTFNLGIGMVLIVSSTTAEIAASALRDAGEFVYKIGQVTKRNDAPKIVLTD